MRDHWEALGGAGENQTHDEGFANLGDLRSGSMSVIDAMFRQSNGQARVRVTVRHPLRQNQPASDNNPEQLDRK